MTAEDVNMTQSDGLSIFDVSQWSRLHQGDRHIVLIKKTNGISHLQQTLDSW